jgi:hypothetical protein
MMVANEFLDPMIVKLPDENEIINFKLDGNDIQMSVKEMQDLYWEYHGVFKFCNQIDNEVFRLSYTDYMELPEILIDVLDIFKQEKRKLLAEKAK